MSRALSRRTVLGGAAATLVAGSAPAAAVSDPWVALALEYAALWQQMRALAASPENIPDALAVPIWDRMAEIADVIAESYPVSLAGALAGVDLLLLDADEGVDVPLPVMKSVCSGVKRHFQPA